MARTRFDDPVHVVPPVGGPSRTKQDQRDAVNVNSIIKKYQRTGVFTHYNGRTPLYGDFSMSLDLKTAMDTLMAAEDAFMRLPAEVRAEADNDPIRFLEMLASEEETELLVDAGLEVDDEDRGKALPRGDRGPESPPVEASSPSAGGAPAPDPELAQ